MDTDDLKKQAVESMLNQRIIRIADSEENFFEKTRNMPVTQYNEEFEKKVTGHLGFSCRPIAPRWRQAGAE